MKLLKYIYSDNLGERLFEMVDLLAAVSRQETGMKAIETYLTYLVRGTDKIDRDVVSEVIKEALADKGAGIMPTIAEQWIEEGKVQGKAEGITIGEERGEERGISIGEQRGEQRALIETIGAFLAHRFEIAPDHYQESLQTLDIDQIKALNKMVFGLESLAEFEARLDESLADAEAE